MYSQFMMHGQKNINSLYRRLGGPQGRSGRMRNISPLPGFDPRIVQSAASGYIDWVIPVHLFSMTAII